MNAWIDELAEIGGRAEEACLITVAGTRGSAPREAGAKMIVTARQSYSSIGGGALEFQCTRIACEQLGSDTPPALRKFTLGTQCGQCCGGIVEVLFEQLQGGVSRWLQRLIELRDARVAAVLVTQIRGAGKHIVTADRCDSFGHAGALSDSVVTAARECLHGCGRAHSLSTKNASGRERRYMIEPVTCSDFNIAIFGAGHVGAATVAAMARLECNIRWIDSRRNIFPPIAADNVMAIESAQPALEVAAMPAQTFYLVMTHSHALDFEICDAILRRADFAYCGLIGSRSKRRRFERLMRQQKMPASLLERLTCPIGIDAIDGKKPEEIAVAVCAQLLCLRSEKGEALTRDADNVRYF